MGLEPVFSGNIGKHVEATKVEPSTSLRDVAWSKVGVLVTDDAIDEEGQAFT
jgi:hypothetical protein